MAARKRVGPLIGLLVNVRQPAGTPASLFILLRGRARSRASLGAEVSGVFASIAREQREVARQSFERFKQ